MAKKGSARKRRVPTIDSVVRSIVRSARMPASFDVRDKHDAYLRLEERFGLLREEQAALDDAAIADRLERSKRAARRSLIIRNALREWVGNHDLGVKWDREPCPKDVDGRRIWPPLTKAEARDAIDRLEAVERKSVREFNEGTIKSRKREERRLARLMRPGVAVGQGA